jgi:hypothetical protein
MTNPPRPHARLSRSLWLALLLACSQPAIMPRGDGGGGGSEETGGRGGKDGGGAPAPFHDAGPYPDAPAGHTDACTPLTCAPAGGRYCGKIGNGCGGPLECGDCTDGLTCGGSGVEHVCGKPVEASCQPISCNQTGGRICGRVGDGCGRPLDCGACPGGQICGSLAPNVCGGMTCDGLCKQQVKCPAGQQTTISGTVRAPTPPRFGAADPLYNVLVYVPNAAVEPFTSGVSCDQCGVVSGAPLVTALTGADGSFVLRDVPAGKDIPLVIQVGRWRRQVKIAQVAPCADTALDAELTRLPRTKAEGNIPHMAIATGTYDPFECTLRKIGIADSEFGAPGGDARVQFYPFGGARIPGAPATPGGAALASSLPTLSQYDIALFPCDDPGERPPEAMKNLLDYTARGGRLFLTDFGYSWLRDGGPLQGTTAWFPGLYMDPTYLGSNFDVQVDQTFPKGKAFAEWLSKVGASRTPGVLPVHDPYGGGSYISMTVPPTQRWLFSERPATVQHFSFNTPIGAAADKQCGRVVFSNFHVQASVTADPGGPAPSFPAHCGPDRPLSPQEKALEFMLFDATSCVQPDTDRPRVFEPPPPAPPLPPPVIL